MNQSFGSRFRSAITGTSILPAIGVYDVFSATLAAQHFDCIFISGFGFAASHYGLPDIGLNSWSDIVAFVQRIRTVLPDEFLLVDIDDGFADAEVACHVVTLLEAAGASGVILEDQARPRRCGHMAGKRILPLESSLEMLRRVLATRSDLVVVARTDASEPSEILRRVEAMSATDADAILVDGIGDMAMLEQIRSSTNKPLAFNQIAGGKSPAWSLNELQKAGVALAIHSIPCLAAAQQAVTAAMQRLKTEGRLEGSTNGVMLSECNEVLNANLHRRSNCLPKNHGDNLANGHALNRVSQ